MNKMELIDIAKKYSSLGGDGNDLTEEQYDYASKNLELVFDDEDVDGKVVTYTEVYKVEDMYIMVWRAATNSGYWSDSEWYDAVEGGECTPIERTTIDYVLTRGI